MLQVHLEKIHNVRNINLKIEVKKMKEYTNLVFNH